MSANQQSTTLVGKMLLEHSLSDADWEEPLLSMDGNEGLFRASSQQSLLQQLFEPIRSSTPRPSIGEQGQDNNTLKRTYSLVSKICLYPFASAACRFDVELD